MKGGPSFSLHGKNSAPYTQTDRNDMSTSACFFFLGDQNPGLSPNLEPIYAAAHRVSSPRRSTLPINWNVRFYHSVPQFPRIPNVVKLNDHRSTLVQLVVADHQTYTVIGQLTDLLPLKAWMSTPSRCSPSRHEFTGSVERVRRGPVELITLRDCNRTCRAMHHSPTGTPRISLRLTAAAEQLTRNVGGLGGRPVEVVAYIGICVWITNLRTTWMCGELRSSCQKRSRAVLPDLLQCYSCCTR